LKLSRFFQNDVSKKRWKNYRKI